MAQLVLSSDFGVHQLLNLDFAKVCWRLINNCKTIWGEKASWEGRAFFKKKEKKTSSYWSASPELYVNKKGMDVTIYVFREKKIIK